VKEVTLPIDTDVKLPAAVLAAAARSEEMIKALNNQEQSQVTSEGNEQHPEFSSQTFLAQPQQADSDPNGDPDNQTWEHKYKSVNGRYTRQQEQVRQMSEQIQNLQNVIGTLQSAPPTTSTILPDLSAEKLITADEERDYGSDFLNVVGKKAREELTPVVKAYEAKIAEMEAKLQGLNGVMAQDSQSKLLSTLDSRMPDWRDLNTNSEFLDWLRLPDPYSGDIRHDMLKSAYARGDASRILNFFNGFLAEEAAVAPAGYGPNQGQTTTVPKVPLENFAAPGRAKTAAGSNSAPVEKPIFTRAQIAAFYSEIAAGKYRGKDDAKNKAEAQIFEAQREGRIR
jgi:hypothetical protein